MKYTDPEKFCEDLMNKIKDIKDLEDQAIPVDSSTMVKGPSTMYKDIESAKAAQLNPAIDYATKFIQNKIIDILRG